MRRPIALENFCSCSGLAGADEIGSDLVPDYLTSLEDGGFYGWLRPKT